MGSPSGALHQGGALQSLSDSDRAELRQAAIAELRRRGLPVAYIIHLTAYLKNPEASRDLFGTPRPFEYLPEHQELYQLATRGLSIVEIVERKFVSPSLFERTVCVKPGAAPQGGQIFRLRDLPKNWRENLHPSLEEFAPKIKRILRKFGKDRVKRFRKARDAVIQAYTARRREAGADNTTIERELRLLMHALILALSVSNTIAHYPKGHIDSMTPFEHFTCRASHGAMVLKGRGRLGWNYFCPVCGWERTAKASKDALGFARGVRQRTAREEIRRRYLAAIRCLCDPPYPWEAIGWLLEAEEVSWPQKKDSDSLEPADVDTLDRLSREHQDVFPDSVKKQIRREARYWSLPIR